MIFHTYGDKGNKAVVLIHGMLTPWQIWSTAAEKFSKDHYVIVPELDAHTEETPTVFNSVEEEAEKILEYIKDELNGHVFLLAGLSMGGRIAATVAKNNDITVETLVLDGAPLANMNGLMKAVMRLNYKSLIMKSKKRDPKVLEQAKRVFIPEDMIPYYVKIAENMIMVSVDNAINSLFSPFEFVRYPDDMKILYMHGTKSNEVVSRKCALKMKKVNPETKIKCFEGLAHAELACFKPDLWIREVEEFIS